MGFYSGCVSDMLHRKVLNYCACTIANERLVDSVEWVSRKNVDEEVVGCSEEDVWRSNVAWKFLFVSSR